MLLNCSTGARCLVRYSGSIKALLRLIQRTGARRLFRQHDAHPVALAQRGLPAYSLQPPLRLYSAYIQAPSRLYSAYFKAPLTKNILAGVAVDEKD